MLRIDEYPALLVNADGRPLSVAPISTVNWQEALTKILAGKYMALAEDEREARSATSSFRLPSVVASSEFVDLNRTARLTRLNLHLASKFRCCFCGAKHETNDLTYDHLIPRARGGVSSWSNVLPACQGCNQRKGCRTPSEANMPLLWQPWTPTRAQINTLATRYANRVKHVHATWLDFLYWDSDVSAP